MLSFVATVVGTALLIFVYVKFIRPEMLKHARIKDAFDIANTHWECIAARLRLWWDMMTGGVLFVAPELLNVLGQIQAAGIDFSFLAPNEVAKVITQTIGLVLILGKAFIMRTTAAVADKVEGVAPIPPVPPVPPIGGS